MKIKTKLRLGFGFLFLVVIGFGGISLYQINEISVRSKIILKDNNNSLLYVSDMRKALELQGGRLNAINKQAFLKPLAEERSNITEVGEEKLVRLLEFYTSQALSPTTYLEQKNKATAKIKALLFQIDEINMQAITRKNDDAQHATQKATLYLGITAAMTFLVLFSFIVNFPSFIANPMAELLRGIREITRKNYKQNLHFSGNDEFAELAEAFNKMAQALRNWDNSNLAQIKSEKQRIDTIISQMQDAIIGVNEHDEILFLNGTASSLLQLPQESSVGKKVGDLVSKNQLLERILQDGAGKEPLKIYADGKQSYFNLEKREVLIPNLEPAEDQPIIESAKFSGKVYILKNITQFKELDEAKTNFIATVSHELKTPLASIKMSLKLLNDERIGEVNSEQQQLIKHINEDSDRLLKITSELLDLAQVETGNLQLNLVKVKPVDIAKLAIEAVAFQAKQKEIEIKLEVGDDLPNITADLQKTTWVMVNFLSNALRYSSSKSNIIVQLSVKDGAVEFAVKDFGKGIEEQYQKRLFDRYYQVPTDGQNKSGSGLGLAISKDFIEAENGQIWVESGLGEGSRFCFNIPIIS